MGAEGVPVADGTLRPPSQRIMGFALPGHPDPSALFHTAIGLG